MVNLKLRLVHKNTIAFNIDDEVYYLVVGHNYPIIFDANLNQLSISNLDSWFQNKTHQRYSYQNVLDLAKAFHDGMNMAYSIDDVRLLVKTIVNRIINVLFQKGKILNYIKIYWVESIDPEKYRTIYGKAIKDNFDKLKKSKNFYNDLCRVWHSCVVNSSNERETYEKLIDRLDKIPSEPIFPDPSKLNDELITIIDDELIKKLPILKTNKIIINNVELLNDRT